MTGEPDPLLDILDEYFRRLEARHARIAREGITPDEDTRRFIERFLNPPLTPEEEAMKAAGLLDPDDYAVQLAPTVSPSLACFIFRFVR